MKFYIILWLKEYVRVVFVNWSVHIESWIWQEPIYLKQIDLYLEVKNILVIHRSFPNGAYLRPFNQSCFLLLA